MEIFYLLHLFCLLYFFACLYFQYEKTDQDSITSSVRSRIAVCVPLVYHITDSVKDAMVQHNLLNLDGLGRRDSVKDAMVQHNLLKLDQMTVKATAIFMFKQNAGLNLSALNHLFLAKSYRYNSRNKSQVIPRCYSTKLNQQSISYRRPSIWNSLPVSIKDKKQSVKTFTKKLTNNST